MSARLTLATVDFFSRFVTQPNIHFSVSYNHPSWIMCGHCDIMKKRSVSRRLMSRFRLHRRPCHLLSSLRPLQRVRPPHWWGGSAHPCWYSCLFSSLKPAAATAGKTEALSGSVGQKCWELIFVWPQCRAMGPRKGIAGYHWIKTLHNRQTMLFFHGLKHIIAIGFLLDRRGK